jgi:bifunctional oligoribonuclease and PAP phosphatase NrnA
VGSCLATWNYITTWFPGVQAQVYLEPVPNIFRFLQGADQICNDQDADICYDLCIVQDCSDTLRPGAFIKYFKTAKKTVCIDHHISNGSFADVNHVFPEVSSTSELIFTLLEEEKITKEIAECIYTGIVHDTGVFQYSSTSARTMNIAGKLMEKGIDFTRIIDETFYTKTYNQNRIMGKALMDSKLYLDGACIASYVTMADMEEFEVLPKHLDGIVSQLRVTKDVELALFLYELEPGRFKLSMRSNNKVNVADIAVTFGGGGHVRAAGADMEGTAEDIIGKICAEAKKQLC